ncbi:MAG: cytochrome C oxidase subunit IV family protein [Planctomycetota bacterium]|nr:cytochrome C oxidase subunit IV family protein [Planctomycetota bacterium]
MSDHAAEHHEEHHEFNLKENLAVWFGLVALTLVEVYLAYVHLPPATMLITLLGLSAIKAAGIMGVFMHLKFERVSFVLTLVPLTIVTIALLAIMFPDALRLYMFHWIGSPTP